MNRNLLSSFALTHAIKHKVGMGASMNENTHMLSYAHTHICTCFDANRYSHCVQTLAYRTLWSKDEVKWKITGMHGIVNSHIALVCVDPVEQSLWCHPFNGQTTLKAYTSDQNKRWAEPAGNIDAQLTSTQHCFNPLLSHLIHRFHHRAHINIPTGYNSSELLQVTWTLSCVLYWTSTAQSHTQGWLMLSTACKIRININTFFRLDTWAWQFSRRFCCNTHWSRLFSFLLLHEYLSCHDK